jgi:pimeloyl-ACP methyl ester carboxylesterase
MKSAYAETPEGQIHYRTAGNGVPVLFIHKASYSSDEFVELMPLLEQKYRLIAVDAMGCGSSDQPLISSPQMTDYALNLIHFLDTLQINKINIVGRLFGASAAVEMAVKFPERVNRLVLCDLLYVEPETLKRAASDFKNETVVPQADGSHLVEVWKGRGGRPGANLNLVQRATVEYLKSGLGARAGDSHRAKFAYDVGPKLPQIKCPVCLLYSQRSGLFPRLAAAQQLLPGAQGKLIENTPAFPPSENPQAYAEAIDSFLRS